MKVASFVKATAILSAAAFVVSVGVAQAQVTKDDGKCRSTVQKNTGKLVATASKAIVGCWKSVMGAKIGYTDCNNSATADTKGKITKAVDKLEAAVGGIKTKCDDTLHAAALAEYQDCPSPGTQGTGMTTFAQVGQCLSGVGTGMADNMHRVAMSPTAQNVADILASANAKDIAKCAGAIQKGFNKLIATVGKEEGAYQVKVLDKALTNPYDYGAHGQDVKGKIQSAADKLDAGIVKSCAPLSQNEFALLGTCGTKADAADCLEEIARNGSSGVTAVSFEMPGVCPGSVTVSSRTRQSNGGAASATALDAGWTGLGMNAELLTFTGGVDLACTDGTCSSCAVTTNCDQGNCRCNGDVTKVCDEPFVADVDDCGGAICDVLFGSPLALNASNTPTCLVTQISQELVGTADIGTGAAATQVFSATKVHLGVSATSPCPKCVGGICDGGDNAGGACTEDGVNPVFGATSYDCPPDPVSNVSGSGLQIDLLFSDAPPDLDSNVPCTFAGGLSGLNCPCAVCTGDPTVPCNSDGDCAGVGGTCSSIGSGEHTQPSGCNDKIDGCVVDAGGDGLCTGGVSGPSDTAMFCDGKINPDGEPAISCLTNADCTTAGIGNCTLALTKKCMMNGDESISLVGAYGGQEGAVLGGMFCAPPTANPGVNGAAGTPGPVRVAIAWKFDGLCPDGVTEYTLGGTSCP